LSPDRPECPLWPVIRVDSRTSVDVRLASIFDIRRAEILQLVAMNQLDLIEPLMTNEADRVFLKDILESCKNLRDWFNFEAADMDSPSRL